MSFHLLLKNKVMNCKSQPLLCTTQWKCGKISNFPTGMSTLAMQSNGPLPQVLPTVSTDGYPASNGGTYFRVLIGTVPICYHPSKKVLPKQSQTPQYETNENLLLLSACTVCCLALILPMWKMPQCMALHPSHSMAFAGHLTIARLCHGFSVTRGASKTGDAGMGVVTKFRHRT